MAGRAQRWVSPVVNARLRVTGHLFQSRFGSVMLDEERVMAAARNMASNPVGARLGERARDWRWSSVRAHLAGRSDELVSVAPLLDRSARRPFSTDCPPLTSRDPRPRKRGPKPGDRGLSKASA
jgi:putative transposase